MEGGRCRVSIFVELDDLSAFQGSFEKRRVGESAF